MMTFCKKHSTLILISFLVILLTLSWFIPSERLFLGIVFLLFSFCIAAIAVLEKQMEAYRQGRITRGALIRNAVLEITGTGLAMVLAGFLGRYFAQAATQQIGNDLIRIIAGIIVGLVVGVCVGGIARKTWGRLVRTSPKG